MTLIMAILVIVTVLFAVARLRGGSAPRLAPPSQTEVQSLLAAGETIEAIKVYRLLTGQGLYEAKQAIERIKATGIWEAPAASAEPAAAADDAIAALVKEDKLIEAIKLYREKHGVDLVTAKNAVDKLAGR